MARTPGATHRDVLAAHDVGGERSGISIFLMDPHTGVKPLGVASGVGHIISVGEQHVCHHPQFGERSTRRARVTGRIDQRFSCSRATKVAVGAEGRLVVVTAQVYVVGHPRGTLLTAPAVGSGSRSTGSGMPRRPPHGGLVGGTRRLSDDHRLARSSAAISPGA